MKLFSKDPARTPPGGLPETTARTARRAVRTETETPARRPCQTHATGATLLLGLCGFWLLLFALPATRATAAELSPRAESWLAAQATVQTWSADFVQTRQFKTLTVPLVSTGRVWFAAPGNFRWELGSPARTVAIRSGPVMLLVYPALQRAEKYALDQGPAGPWRDASTLLEAGFPKSRAGLEKQFELVSETETNNFLELALRPKAPAARRMMPQLKITIDPPANQLVATEMTFADGSRMRNAFSRQTINAPPPERAFSTNVPPGYKLVEPAKKAR